MLPELTRPLPGIGAGTAGIRPPRVAPGLGRLSRPLDRRPRPGGLAGRRLWSCPPRSWFWTLHWPFSACACGSWKQVRTAGPDRASRRRTRRRTTAPVRSPPCRTWRDSSRAPRTPPRPSTRTATAVPGLPGRRLTRGRPAVREERAGDDGRVRRVLQARAVEPAAGLRRGVLAVRERDVCSSGKPLPGGSVDGAPGPHRHRAGTSREASTDRDQDRRRS